MAVSIDQAMRRAQDAESRGRPDLAVSIYQQILRQMPSHFPAHAALKRLQSHSAQDPAARVTALYRQGRLAEAAKAADQLSRRGAVSSSVLNVLGAARLGLGDAKAAVKAFRAVLKTAPDNPAAHNNLGTALRAQGDLAAAEQAFRRALQLRPGYSDALNNLGLIHRDRGDGAAAQKCFEEAVSANRSNAKALMNLGNLAQEENRAEDAAAAYRQALKAAPKDAEAHYNLALALRKLGRPDEAIASYRAALRHRPGFAEAENNLANTLKAQRKFQSAEESYRRAVAQQPDYAEAWTNLGILLQEMMRTEEAIAAFETALNARPDYAPALAQALYQKAQICDWSLLDRFEAEKARLGIETEPVDPLTLLAVEDSGARQHRRAEAYARANFPTAQPPLPARPRDGRKLRIGYFSADFRNHPVARLFAGTLAAHDRDKVELLAYAFGPRTDDEMRQEMAPRFDRFTDILDMPDAEGAALIRDHGLDVAVDMTGYTMHSRTGLFAHRIAPVQVNYLGYPGTSGASFMDYLVGDPVLIPEDRRAHVSEAVLYLPHTYQPNDNRRPVPEAPGTRADHGLPEDELVFCCFNANYKITPAEFDIWMRVLTKVPGSVLWMLGAGTPVEANLRAAAKARGVASDRLIFAPRVPPEAHLARHRHADLFLDTFAYNAHTTASDALWMALPVVTLAGDQFAARVAASLTTAAGVPQTVATTREGYEEMILALAAAPEKRAEMRAHLEENRRSLPIFDTEGYTRALENAFLAAHDRAVDGLPPADIRVSA